MSVCIKCKTKLNSARDTMCTSCYFKDLGLSEGDLEDKESMVYAQGLNSPIEFEPFYLYSIDKLKLYLAER